MESKIRATTHVVAELYRSVWCSRDALRVVVVISVQIVVFSLHIHVYTVKTLMCIHIFGKWEKYMEVHEYAWCAMVCREKAPHEPLLCSFSSSSFSVSTKICRQEWVYFGLQPS